MRRSLRYIISHCVVFIMERKYEFLLKSFDFISSIILFAAICLMMFTRWDSTGSIPILSLGIMTLFIFPFSIALQYYFDQRQASRVLYHTWIGALLGTILLSNSLVYRNDVKEIVANYLLFLSLVFKLVWHFADRISDLALYTPRPMQLDAFFEMLGFSFASFATDSFHISLSVLALAFLMITFLVRAKSFFGILLVVPFVVIAVICYFPSIGVTPNYYAFASLGCRLLMEPILDIYFAPLTATERWKWFILIGPIQRVIVSLFLYPILDLVFLSLCIMVFRKSPSMATLRLLAIIIIFTISLFCWLCSHVVFTLTIWLFTGKLRECSTAYKHCIEEDSNMNRILSAKGFHCFTLITRNILRATLLSSVVLGLVSWQTDNPLFIATFLLTIPVEFAVCVILRDLGGAVSGTCVGYSVIAPANYFRTDGNVAVLPPDTFDEVNQRANDTLKNVQQFFRHHYIDMVGCDFLSGGVLASTLEDRLKDLFKRSTSDGPRFDTYVVFYSGHVYQNGNWALADGTEFSLATILKWWKEWNVNSRSRLILILDTEHSSEWIDPVRSIDGHFVSVQTWLPTRDTAVSNDTESLLSSSPSSVGEFTKTWVGYNCSDGALSADLVFRNSPFRPCYSVSRRWTDFDFQRLEQAEIKSYIHNNFPRLTWSIVAFLEPSQKKSQCMVSPCVYCRRMKARWLPAKLLETGHGFQLVGL